MLRAALTSAWSLNPHPRQQNTACEGRLAASVGPQDEQRWLVPLGFTTITSRPASALSGALRGASGALYATIEMRPPHEAARISRLSPAFCATWEPGSSRVPLAERTMLAILRSSNTRSP